MFVVIDVVVLQEVKQCAVRHIQGQTFMFDDLKESVRNFGWVGCTQEALTAAGKLKTKINDQFFTCPVKINENDSTFRFIILRNEQETVTYGSRGAICAAYFILLWDNILWSLCGASHDQEWSAILIRTGDLVNVQSFNISALCIELTRWGLGLHFLNVFSIRFSFVCICRSFSKVF